MSAGGYVGVDVQVSRGCPYVVLDLALKRYASGWLAVPDEIRAVVRSASKVLGPIAIGIDAPRCGLRAPREHYWTRRGWRARHASETGHGRHCEIVLAALKLATPQWTPLLARAPDWMHTGFRLFEALATEPHVYEVFPTAAYRQLNAEQSAHLSVSLHGFADGRRTCWTPTSLPLRCMNSWLVEVRKWVAAIPWAPSSFRA